MISQPRQTAWEKVIHTALDALFPPSCAGCKARGAAICQACKAKAAYTGNECFFCGIKADRTHVCKACARGSKITSIVWRWRYNTREAHDIIASFKYRKKRALARVLAAELWETLSSAELADGLVVIPVPLHPVRLRERGFNQAELIAENLGLPKANGAVVRVRETPPQARATSKRERIAHVRGAFAVTDKSAIRGKNILIVDDVATTGATIVELARVLKRAGAREVHAAVIAHG